MSNAQPIMRNDTRHTPTFVPPNFNWDLANEIFGIRVPADDSNLLRFLVDGVWDIELLAAKDVITAFALVSGIHSLEAGLWIAAQHKNLLRPNGPRYRPGMRLQVFCHGVVVLANNQNQLGQKLLLVLAGRHPPKNGHLWGHPDLLSRARSLWAEHETALSVFEGHQQRQKVERDKLYERLPELKNFDGFGPLQKLPTANFEPLLPFLRLSVTHIWRRSATLSRLESKITHAVETEGFSPPRSGQYEGLLSLPTIQGHRIQTSALAVWSPYRGPTAYPEIRWAVQKGLPRALRRPRVAHISPPSLGSALKEQVNHSSVEGFPPENSEYFERFTEKPFDPDDIAKRAQQSRSRFQHYGFEALAWYQPYHCWTENTWGIYFDGNRLDDFAASLLDDCRREGVRRANHLIPSLSFGLVYAHELFHAKVEAAASWLEVCKGKNTFLPYQKNVYEALTETPEWLEEALANWSSWEWLHSEGVRKYIKSNTPDFECIAKIVANSLDLSPPGYREWRLGEKHATWREFCLQIGWALKKSMSPRLRPPAENLLLETPPYSFESSDVPVHFIGFGIITDHLQSHPATLNVISRREIQKALKHFHYEVDVSEGKGSHEKWTGPDNRAFPLPRKDPVSGCVFKSFLDHFEIDKRTYVHKVRPML